MSHLLLGATVLLLVLVGWISADIMGLAFWKSNRFPVEGQTVLLTGSSQGMGREIARLLSARGASLILVARTTKNLEAAVDYAKAHARNPTTQRFTYISADVTSESENARVVSEAIVWNNGKMPEIVWCIAGSSTPGLFVETRTDTLRKQMELNYFAAAYLAHATLKAWLYPEQPSKPQAIGKAHEPPRKFIITSSVLAFVNLAGYSPYAPAKAALRSLADGLRSEVQLYNAARRSKSHSSSQAHAPFDVNIHLIFPGTILSPGFENEEKTKHPVTRELESSDPKQTEMEAATAAVKGLEAGNYMTSTNWLGELMRLGTLSGSEKNSTIFDTLGALIATLIWLFVVPDLNSKVWSWGKKNGMPKFRRDAQ